ncbi:MAG TPA: 50S ribosomal protein L10 [Patescibacteria group bacterium]
MKKTEKKEFIEKLTTKLKGAKSVSLVDFAGMGVKPQQELKKKLKEAKGSMFVAKNTLFRIAGKEANLPEELLTDTILKGQTAVVIAADDPISPIQVIGKFLATSEAPQMKAGVVEGIYQNKESLMALSKLPSREVLVSQAVGAIAGPMYGIVTTLNSKMQELIYILSTKAGGDTNG